LDSAITIITGEDSASEVELLNIIQYGLGITNPASSSTSSSGSMADNALSACIRAAKIRRHDLARIVKEAVGFEKGQRDLKDLNVRFSHGHQPTASQGRTP